MRKKENKETLELKAKCAKKLKGLSERVLTDDRRDAMEEFGISYQTIYRYLKGDVLNLQLGVKMYEFLNDRIERRKEVLA